MSAIEFCILPPAVCLAINSSGVTPEYSGGESTPMGVSRLLLTAEASSSPKRRGIGRSPWRSPYRIPCSKFVCATASSSRLSESGSNSIKRHTLSSWQRRQTRNKPGRQNDDHAVRTCFSLKWTRAAVPAHGRAPGSERSVPPCSSDAFPPILRPPASPRHRQWQKRRCPLMSTSAKGLRES